MLPLRPPFPHAITYPEALPISQKITEIAQAMQNHQVIVVAGETGSGKTTQLPKMALQLGRGLQGRIGHTQPRRVAARSVAARLAEELQVSLGEEVGYQIRFTDRVQAHSYIKLMTDGILLAELKKDRLLRQYDTLIIDEAHERSLNIDCLLGYLQRLLPKRPDLKVIITSATLDHQRFATYFKGAPLIEVSGRTFPVDIRYRPLDEQQELNQAIYQAVKEVWLDDPSGDVLVFLSGERAIREAMAFFKKQALGHTELLPLYARLSSQDQHKIFALQGTRRIVFSTNVAETSLTVPGIKYVIDTGLARIKRYSYRSKIQRLPIEAIAQANAQQRAGRCGRTSPGICIRLYSEEDFALRAAYTEPEILRSHLASVILQMLDLGLGSIEHFPFLDKPDGRFIRDGEKCLWELAAVNDRQQLTAIGKDLLYFPIDPRLARVLIEAHKKQVLPWALIVVAALSSQDVRDRPMEKSQAADQAHQPYLDDRSDFGSLIVLWQHLHQQQQHLSNKQFRDYCQRHYLSYLRFKEWQDLVKQLSELCHEKWPGSWSMESVLAQAWREQPLSLYNALHQAIVSGFASHVLQKTEQKEYLGTRHRKFHLFPGASVYKKPPAWLVGAEMVETSRLYVRQVAAIEPDWLESLVPHLLKKTYREPTFDPKRGEVVAFERVMLLGLTLIAQRRIAYGKIDAAQARRVFIQQALAEGQYTCDLYFARHNQALFAKVHELEQKLRDRLDGLPIDALSDFFDQALPEGIYDVRTFSTWYKKASTTQPHLLCLNEAWFEQFNHRGEDYPSQWQFNEHRLPLSYQFAPGAVADGVTLHVPWLLWRQIPKSALLWLVPGLLEAKISALFKHLPKSYRRTLPSNMAQGWRSYIQFGQGCLFEQLNTMLEQRCGLSIPFSVWQAAEQAVPEYLRFYLQIWDGEKAVVASRQVADIDAWLAQQPPVTAASSEQMVHHQFPEQALPVTDWVQQNGLNITVYLAWQSVPDGIVKTVVDDEQQAQHLHRSGVLHGLKIACQEYLQRQVKKVFKAKLQVLLNKTVANSRIKIKALSHQQFFEHYHAYVGDEQTAWLDICDALLTENFADDWWAVRDAVSFQALLDRHQADLNENLVILMDDWCVMVEQLMSVVPSLQTNSSIEATVLNDIQQQLTALIYPGCFAQTPYPWRERLPIYLQGIRQRLSKEVKAMDIASQQQVQTLYQQWQALKTDGQGALEFRFMLEEFRLSLFAQPIKTFKPVSLKRLTELYQSLRG